MLYGLLVTLYVFVCLFMVLLILIQQGKSSMGLGTLGGGAQMLFGGSGGQDIFQKITWVLGAIFIFGSLMLTLLKHSEVEKSRYLGQVGANIPAQVAQQPLVPLPLEVEEQ